MITGGPARLSGAGSFSMLLLLMYVWTKITPLVCVPLTRLKAMPERYERPFGPLRHVGSAPASSPCRGDARPSGVLSCLYPGSSAFFHVNPPSVDHPRPIHASPVSPSAANPGSSTGV